jgi:hypothetical protein
MLSRHFITQVFFAGLVLAGANFAIGLMAKTTVASELLHKCRTHINYTDLFIGNSLIASGIDEKTFNESSGGNRIAFNAGCGSTSPLEHALILQEAKGPDQGTIFYGFYDTQLTDIPTTDWRSLVGNRTIVFKTDLNNLINLAETKNYLDILVLKFLANAPLIYERLAIWSKVEKARRVIGGVGTTPSKNTRFGRKEDFKLLEPKNTQSFDATLEKTVSTQSSLSKPIQKIISHKNKIVFILMPMTRNHRQNFNSSDSWKSYFQHVKGLLKNQNIELVDALDWIDDPLFEDNLHLSKAGAIEFSRQLRKFAKARE